MVHWYFVLPIFDILGQPKYYGSLHLLLHPIHLEATFLLNFLLFSHLLFLILKLLHL